MSRQTSLLFLKSGFLLIVFLFVFPSTLVSDAHGQEKTQLVVQQIEIAPKVLKVEDEITIKAIIVNNGNTPVYNLQLGAAVDSSTSSYKWTTIDKNPSQPISILSPGEKVNFYARIKIPNSGKIRIGVAGIAENAILNPTGQTVNIMQPLNVFINTLLLFVLYLLILVFCLIILRMLVARSKKNKVILQPVKPAIIVSFAFMILIPLSLLSLLQSGLLLGSTKRAWIYDAAVVFFVLGWILMGAFIRPNGSLVRGAIAAAILYIFIGLLWTIGFNVALGADLRTLFSPPFLSSLTSTTLLILAWPIQIIGALGIFGLALGN